MKTKQIEDSGGAHAKGFSADEKPGTPPPPDDPIPLAKTATGHVVSAEPESLPPTGRDEAEGEERGRILGESA